MKEKVLITGGTGLVGNRLTAMLLEAGFDVGILTRGATREKDNVQYYHWDVAKQFIDENALSNVSYIINLVGANVAEGRWTDARKKVIIESRTETTGLLFREVQSRGVKLKAFLSASAIGIYGNDEGDHVKTETSSHGDDFLAEVVKVWEKAAEQFNDIDVRTVLLRIGIVLDPNGGALAKIAQPIKLNAGAPLGSGKQYMSWVHNEDLCRVIMWAMQNEEAKGPYNVVNPNPVTNASFTKSVAKILKKPLWLPNVPGFTLKLMLGEMASIVLGGIKVSCEKLISEGFTYKYQHLEDALEDLL